MLDDNFSYSEFFDSNSLILPKLTSNKSEIFNTNIESIKKDYNSIHYFCTKCLKFPFIKFCKDRKNIRFTCSCINNKKISIEDLFRRISDRNIFSETNSIINAQNALLCKNHNKKFKGFSKFYLNNYCEDCHNYIDEFDDNDIIRFNEIKIEEIKIEQLNREINGSGEIYNDNKINIINDSNFEKLEQEEEKRFKNLINIILNDYKNYPNFSILKTY